MTYDEELTELFEQHHVAYANYLAVGERMERFRHEAQHEAWQKVKAANKRIGELWLRERRELQSKSL